MPIRPSDDVCRECAMLSTLVKIERDDRTIMIYADRARLGGAGAAAITARIHAALDGFSDFHHLPTHTNARFAWTVELDTAESAVEFLLMLVGQQRGR